MEIEEFIIAFLSGIASMTLIFVIVIDWSFKLKALQKDGKLETKKGVYTFTPKEKKE